MDKSFFKFKEWHADHGFYPTYCKGLLKHEKTTLINFIKITMLPTQLPSMQLKIKYIGLLDGPKARYIMGRNIRKEMFHVNHFKKVSMSHLDLYR